MEQMNKMGTMPIKKLILTMSWPMMLSMLIQALYNLVDSIFVSRLADEAFVALGYAFPAQTLMIAICVGTGVGVNAMLARRLGEKDAAGANAIAIHGYFLFFFAWLAFLLFGLLLGRHFVGFFTQDALVKEYGAIYLSIVSIGSLGMCMQFSGERILQASGNSFGPMVIQGVGAVINLVLDPILIFGIEGIVPAMGVAGAAIATILGQWVGMILGFIMVHHCPTVSIQFKGFRLQRRVIATIYRIGLPAIVMQSLTTVMTLGLNKIAAMAGDSYTFVLTAYFKLQSFVFMPVYGLNNGCIPVFSYNFGSRNGKRIQSGIRFALVLALAIMVVGALLFFFFPGLLLALFNTSDELLLIGIPALRIISLSFPLAAVSILLSAAFQSLGSPMGSMLLSLLRMLVIVLPAAFLFTLRSPDLMWWSIPLAEFVGLIVALLLYRVVHREHLDPIMHPQVSDAHR